MKINKLSATMILVLAIHTAGSYSGARGGDLFRQADEKPANQEIAGNTGPVPDYSRLEFWSASPYKHDPSDSIPRFLGNEIRDQRADLFFIHPTSFFPDDEGAWNADLTDKQVNLTTDYRSVLFQSTIFNGSCRIFAPRYRQAGMKVFYVRNSPEAIKAFQLAYDDIKEAFRWYLRHENNGRPIVIASHSQGSLHAIRLLQEFFDGTPLQKQLVCAYVAGYRIEKSAFRKIPVGEHALQTGCVVGWRTYAEGEIPESIRAEKGSSICVNPLTWTTGDSPGTKDMHLGIMLGFEKIIPHTVSAIIEPSANILWVDTPVVLEEGKGKLKNLHTYDFNLFWMNIRINVKERIDAWYNL